ncbi:MAG: translation elongation factor Ts [Planctomycetota bacterium]
MEITPAMVKAMREKTGLPMMECKKALEETQGNEQAAMDLLRRKGLAQVTKRAERVTAEGRIGHHHDPARGCVALVEVLCETAPVANTDEIVRLTRAAAEAAARLEAPTPEALLEQPLPSDPARRIADLLHDAVNKIRENIKIGRVTVLRGSVGCYLHHDARKAAVVELSGPAAPEVASDICMHIVSMRPPFARREEVDPALVEQRRQAAREQVKNKPPQIMDKIVTGMLDKWYSEIALLEQPFVKDDKRTVAQYLREQSPGLTVNRFVRLEIGEA